MLRHARAQRAALADVERRAALAEEDVDPGRLGNGVDHRALDVRRQRGNDSERAHGTHERNVAVRCVKDAGAGERDSVGCLEDE